MKERTLPPLEKACLRWIARGRTIAEIASIEGKSVADIESCVQSTLVALKAKSIKEALQKADLSESDRSISSGALAVGSKTEPTLLPRAAGNEWHKRESRAQNLRSRRSKSIPLVCDGVLAQRRIFHVQPVKGPIASCGRFGFASR
ncbi:helix-turn-helix domain-containing protein (plasmid) [Rhizobium etli 8C-3]|uniref:Helix-turn-helix domain-containing protein n=1 Tax=Rhizobium etli 8C-3 TaxID=538025 RepID=A0A1L5PAW7_RHIET|nr:helix-turn-helix domain-containing protein [Rhizobium etli 8C-3]